MAGLSRELILPQLVHARATSPDGERPFLAEIDGSARTYKQVDAEARQWAGYLRQLGVKPGDRVAVMLPTSINSILVWLACGWLRCYEVPIHVDFRGTILAHVLNHSAATVLIIDEQFIEGLLGLTDEFPELKAVVVVSSPGAAKNWHANATPAWKARLVADTRPAGEFEADDGPEYWDTGAIVYTSGTTGRPKGVMVPWRMFYKHGEIFFPLADVDQNDAFYCPVALSHIAGRVAIYNMALCGGRAVLRKRFSIEAFWDDIAKYNCTSALLIGSIAEMLWRRPPLDTDAKTPLRNVLMAPLIPQVEQFKERFGVRVRTQFGMTETMAPVVSGIRNDWDLANAQSCGRVLKGMHCRVADENDEPVEPGKSGELLIRADDPWLVMSGYWQDAESTARAFRNQWFHTGDAFRYDEDGNFYFVDRIKDTIRRRGENISSFMVEQTIGEYPDIAECAVVGVASEFTEQEIHAFVVAKPGVSIESAKIVKFLDGRLPAFMIPRFWSVVEALPRTPTQRVRKVELREWAKAQHPPGSGT